MNRFLLRERYEPKDLFDTVKEIINIVGGILSVDDTYEEDGDILVVAGSGGISTFAVQGAGKNWWKLDRGTDIPNELRLVNDYSNH